MQCSGVLMRCLAVFWVFRIQAAHLQNKTRIEPVTGSQEFNTISDTGYKKTLSSWSFVFKSQLSYHNTNSAEEEPEMWLKAPEELAFRHWVQIFFFLFCHTILSIFLVVDSRGRHATWLTVSATVSHSALTLKVSDDLDSVSSLWVTFSHSALNYDCRLHYSSAGITHSMFYSSQQHFGLKLQSTHQCSLWQSSETPQKQAGVKRVARGNFRCTSWPFIKPKISSDKFCPLEKEKNSNAIALIFTVFLSDA